MCWNWVFVFLSLSPSSSVTTVIVLSPQKRPRISQVRRVFTGHGRTGALPDHHHSLLQRSHGVPANVWHHKPGVVLCCTGLVGRLPDGILVHQDNKPPCVSVCVYVVSHEIDFFFFICWCLWPGDTMPFCYVFNTQDETLVEPVPFLQ